MNPLVLSLTVGRFVAAAVSVVLLGRPRSLTAMVARHRPALPARQGQAAQRLPSSSHCDGVTPAAEAEQLSATPAAGAAFLEATLAAQIRAEQALHGGDGTPRRSTRSHDDPVTLFGAGVHSRTGWRDVGAVFDWLATTFTSGSDYRFERLAADAGADLAYTVGLECQRASTPTGEVVNNALRATHVHRREPGVGKIVYRHGEPVPSAASDVAVVLSPEPGRR